MTPGVARFVASLAAAAALSACGGGSATLPNLRTTQALNARHYASAEKIQHVVIVVQENRSLNNLFYGYPGARTVTYGYDTTGKKIGLKPIGLDTDWDINHSAESFFSACNGQGKYPGTHCRMNGFDGEGWGCGRSGQPKCPIAHPPYAYVPHAETKPYFQIAEQYVLADEMFSSNFDSTSFASHQYIISGQANSSVDIPVSAWGCPGGSSDTVNTVDQYRNIGNPITACWDVNTLGDELDSAHLAWAYYTSPVTGDGGIWSAYQVINHIYNGPDWTADVISPQTSFFSDVSGGKLRTITWITPTFENSDHAGSRAAGGPSWVASIVNAIGQSQYWKNTAIFIFWDDYGGWYDPQAPKKLDYDGLGMRIPMLVVSAYAKKNHVSHVHYEHGSILRFIENTFGLSQLAASDKRATPPDDAFDFNKPSRKFVTIKSKYDINFFKHQPLDTRPIDNE